MRNPWRAGGIDYHEDVDTIVRARKEGFHPVFRLTKRLQDALRTLERCDQDLLHFAPDTATSRRLLRDALSRNAYGTASIEGNPMTLEAVQSLLNAGPTPEKVTQPDEREILNIAGCSSTWRTSPSPPRLATCWPCTAASSRASSVRRGRLR
ncbi:MAG: hypothetical protein ACYDBQ_06245 [Thermoplasmatota archaeon]